MDNAGRRPKRRYEHEALNEDVGNGVRDGAGLLRPGGAGGRGVQADGDTLYQVALLQSLVQGNYDGIVTVGELKRHGDTGIDTFEGVNGEMIALDVALAEDQTEFDYEDIRDTIVGQYCPDYMGGLDTPRWHSHFISEDRTRGGRVLQVSVREAEAAFDLTDGFEMALSRDAAFQDMELAKDVDEAIHRAETTTGNHD